MASFAKIDGDGKVLQVIVAEQEYIDSGAMGSPDNFIQCTKNTRRGKHILGGTPLRKNYPGIGWQYDKGRDAFLTPPPDPEKFPNWTFSEETCGYEPPIPKPEGNDTYGYAWDKDLRDGEGDWKKVNLN
tara:strand:+ start:317 stop:703 length:387 start_codon:yes stop_codon:yes gene_type:complete